MHFEMWRKSPYFYDVFGSKFNRAAFASAAVIQRQTAYRTSGEPHSSGFCGSKGHRRFLRCPTVLDIVCRLLCVSLCTTCPRGHGFCSISISIHSYFVFQFLFTALTCVENVKWILANDSHTNMWVQLDKPGPLDSHNA